MKTKKKKAKGNYCKCIPVALILLLSFGSRFSLGSTKAYFGTHFAQNEGVNTQKKNLLRKCTPVVSAQLLFLGARFSHSRLRAQNPPLVGILPTLLGVKTKSKKKFLLQMHPRGVGPIAFFRGAILAWEATFLSQGSTSSKLGRGSTAPK